MIKKLLFCICGVTVSCSALAEISASVFWYQEKETGTAATKMRYLVADEFIRIDEGNESDDYILFDALKNTIYSINHADQSVLVIEQYDWDMPGFEFDHQVTDTVLKGAPPIAGKTVKQYLVTGDNKVCTDVQYIPGLYPEKMAMMQRYQKILAGQQVRSLNNTPKELHTPCFLADQVYNDGGYYARGLPVQVWHSRGYARILTDFGDELVAEELFNIPEEFRYYYPYPQQQGDAE